MEDSGKPLPTSHTTVPSVRSRQEALLCDPAPSETSHKPLHTSPDQNHPGLRKVQGRGNGVVPPLERFLAA